MFPQPSKRSTARRRTGGSGVGAVLALTLSVAGLAATTPAAVADPTGTPAPDQAGVVAGVEIDPAKAKLAAGLRSGDPDRVVSVFVRTAGTGALEVDAKAKGGRLAGRGTSGAARARVRAVDVTSAAVVAEARKSDPRVRELYTTAYTVPGVALIGRADRLAKLAERTDVVSVTPIVTKELIKPVTAGNVDTPSNSASAVYTRALQAWQQTGRTGTGIKIAVIDTGVDYTHAMFGGPGTKAAYATARASSDTPDPSWYDATKYLGGYDFAGRTYNADGSNPAYDPFPQPDANPIDGPGGGHGTHVAGTAAGYGLDAGGGRFAGDYAALTAASVRSFQIGPGSAPSAGLYALKVFGDNGGATNVSGAAIDWVGQALTEGKDIDVINMSLGSSYSAVDDPDNAKIDALVDRGVVPVISAGNSGDLTDVAGSPGNSIKALAVAAADSGHALVDGVEVKAPAELTAANPYHAQYSENFVLPIDVTAPVVALSDTANATGCSAFSDADRERVSGKIVWLEWDDASVGCGSAARFDNASTAGAVGVLLTGTQETFSGGIAGNEWLPGAHLNSSATAALRPALTADTLEVSLRDDLREVIESDNAAIADSLASFSSRGVHGSMDDVVKPDVAAPGVNVVSARAGSGTGREQMSGTSMAAPHTAGVVALTMEAHPTWSAARIKAAVMNTATHDLHAEGGSLFSLERQGTGRIDALQAVQNQVTIESQQNPGLVTASFGVTTVETALARARTLVLENSGPTAVTYRTAIVNRMAQQGVRYTVSPARVTVPAGGKAKVRVRLTVADAAALRRSIDATSAKTINGYVREFVAAATGLVTFTPNRATSSPLRVGVFAAVKPVSTLRGTPVAFANAAATTAGLRVNGGDVDQGDAETGYRSLAAPFVLGATSPRLDFRDSPSADSLAAADLRAVGMNSTAPLAKNPAQGMISFGVQTWAPISNPGVMTVPSVLIDVSGDNRPDFETITTKLDTSDVTVVVTFDLGTGQAVDVQPYNVNHSGHDATTFDNAVAVLPVSLAKLGYTRTTKATKLTYQVRTMSNYAPSLATDGSPVVDSSAKITVDVYRPALWFSKTGGAPYRQLLLPDDTLPITVHRAAPSGSRILLLHLQNAPSRQGDVLSTVTPSAAAASRAAGR